MKYMGSKSRVAKHIVPIIQKYIDDSGAKMYFEPMIGGANVIDKIKCESRIGSDINPYLIALLRWVRDGGQLPEDVDKPFYDEMRNEYYQIESGNVQCSLNEKLDMWVIGAVGFLASYNGRFFDGGYAKPGYEKTKMGQRYRNYYQEAKANLLSQVGGLKDVVLLCNDYKTVPLNILSNTVIYVDPPYNKTKQYLYSKDFDYNEFWKIMREWSKNNIVLISELDAPDDFECIWSQEVSRSIDAEHKTRAVEKLWKYKGE